MNLRQQRLSPNNLERQGYAILDSIGLAYRPQELIADKFTVDAFLPEHNTIIQFDGDYWHGNPDKFQSLDHRQEKRVRLDRSQEAYFAKCGYTVLRFWECDIKKRPEWVTDQITASLHLFQVSPIPQEHTAAALA